jgi:D-inositol-3-phosphate glycosyltransferase
MESQAIKNILIVVHHYPPHISGVGMVAHNHAKLLVARGHQVTVITSQTDEQEISCVMDGVKIIRIKALNFTENWGAPFPIFSPRVLSVLSREIRKANIVHIHDAFYISSFLAAVIAHNHKKPIIVTQHVSMINHPSSIVMAIQKIVYSSTGAYIFRVADKILTYNYLVKQFLSGRGVATNKIETLNNGVDTQLFAEVNSDRKVILRKKLGLALDKKVILFVGRFVPKKGFTKVLAAESAEYQLAFAGTNALKDNTATIVFLGKFLPSNVCEAYQAADVFILPSESEGFPLSIQEAMSCGLPVITTNDEGYKDYNLDPLFMSLIDNPTDESVRAAINSIINDEHQLQAMAAYSRQYAENNFSWTVIIDQLERAYNSIINNK